MDVLTSVLNAWEVVGYISSSIKMKVLVVEQSEDYGEICHSIFPLNGPVLQAQPNPWLQEKKAESKWEMRKKHEIWDEQGALGEEIHEEKGFTWMRRGREGNPGIWEGVGGIRVRSCFSFCNIFCQASVWQGWKQARNVYGRQGGCWQIQTGISAAGRKAKDLGRC